MGVPSPVATKEQATYILSGTSEEKKPGWAKIAFTGQIHSDNEASVRMIDRASGVIVFAYAVDKKKYSPWPTDYGRSLCQALERTNREEVGLTRRAT
jgi:hypothetical protein